MTDIKPTHTPARERRARTAAQRANLTLRKSRTRDVNAPGHGLWWIVDDASGALVTGGEQPGWDFDQVESYLAKRTT